MVTQKQIEEMESKFRRKGWDTAHIELMVRNWKRRQERKERGEL